jgi:hypothetical protein
VSRRASGNARRDVFGAIPAPKLQCHPARNRNSAFGGNDTPIDFLVREPLAQRLGPGNAILAGFGEAVLGGAAA